MQLQSPHTIPYLAYLVQSTEPADRASAVPTKHRLDVGTTQALSGMGGVHEWIGGATNMADEARLVPTKYRLV
ncbi:MAG: hypothetical protein ABI947_23515 [Chloroflexota bacterium]